MAVEMKIVEFGSKNEEKYSTAAELDMDLLSILYGSFAVGPAPNCGMFWDRCSNLPSYLARWRVRGHEFSTRNGG
jgi:hypothetical protein